jgi:hypothetical protein
MKKIFETLYCDRCGKEARALYTFEKPLKIWWWKGFFDTEICGDCITSLKKWWEEPSHD